VLRYNIAFYIFLLQNKFEEIRMKNRDSKVGKFISKIEHNVINNFYKKFHDKGILKDYEMVDQIAVAAAMFEDIVTTKVSVRATVELKGDYSRGMMVVDWNECLSEEPNVDIVTGVDMAKFTEVYEKAFVNC